MFSFRISVAVMAGAGLLAGCVGGGSTGATGGGSGNPGDPSSPSGPAASEDERGSVGPPAGDGGECGAPPSDVLVAPGGAFARLGAGSALRLSLVYQGPFLGVTSANVITKVITPGAGAWPSGSSGYWAELRDAGGNVLFTRRFSNPTRLEAPPPADGDGGFLNSTVPYCDPKSIGLDVPNDPKKTQLIVYAPAAYGTDGPAVEIARYSF